MDKILSFLKKVGSKIPRTKRVWRYKASFEKKFLDKQGLAKVMTYNVTGRLVRVGRKGQSFALEACRLHIAYQYHVKPRNLEIHELKLIKKQEVHNEPRSPSPSLLLPHRHKQDQGPTKY